MRYKENKSEIVPVRMSVAQKIQLKKDVEKSVYRDVGKYVRAKLGLLNA